MTFARQLRQRGREEGIQQGKLEGQGTIAVTLLKRDFPVADVHSIIGLPLDRLEQLFKG